MILIDIVTSYFSMEYFRKYSTPGRNLFENDSK